MTQNLNLTSPKAGAHLVVSRACCCNKGLLRPDKLENIAFTEINKPDNMRLLKDVAKLITRYQKFRDILI